MSARSPYSASIAARGTGRFWIAPSERVNARVNCALVTGCGATPSSTPVAAGASSACRNRPTMSCRWIQLIHCAPLPSRPAADRRNSGSICASAPPWRASTMPVRTTGTRSAGRAASGASSASHARTTSGRKPVPALLCASSSSSPRSPWMPLADPCTNTRTPAPCASTACTSARVPSTRESRISALCASVQRLSATGSPARCSTASTPASAAAGTGCVWFQVWQVAGNGRRRRAAARSRTRQTTSSPRATRALPSSRPISPVAPVNRMRMQMPRWSESVGVDVAWKVRPHHRAPPRARRQTRGAAGGSVPQPCHTA
jgi:hypothetical protein